MVADRCSSAAQFLRGELRKHRNQRSESGAADIQRLNLTSYDRCLNARLGGHRAGNLAPWVNAVFRAARCMRAAQQLETATLIQLS